MKNSAKAGSPMSAIEQVASPPLRLPGNPAQSGFSADSSSGTIIIPTVNHIAPAVGPRQISAFRIAGTAMTKLLFPAKSVCYRPLTFPDSSVGRAFDC